MRKLLLLATLCLLAAPAWATLAFDAATEGTGTTTFTWTHTPVGTPRGVFAFCITNGVSTDVVSGMTYGGVAMTFMERGADTATEQGSTEGYFLGASIPTGNQTVECTVSSGTSAKWGVAITVTAGADTQAAGTGSCSVSNNAADPTCTISSIAGASYGAAALFSGFAAPSSITADSDHTMRHDNDLGAQSSAAESSTSEQASGDQVIGFTAGLEDVAMVAIAIEEAGAPPPASDAPVQIIMSQALRAVVRSQPACAGGRECGGK